MASGTTHYRLVQDRLALIFGVALVVAVLYWDSFASLVNQWNISDHAHGLVIFPIAAFLLWQRRDTIQGAAIRPSMVGLFIVALLVGVWIAGKATVVGAVEHFATVALIPAAVLAFLGGDLARRAAFPLLFVLFAVPVSDALIPHLMLLTADISTFLLRMSGIPVLREGQYLALPGGSFVVADVCSGVRYLMAGLVVSTIYVYYTFTSLGRRVAFVAVTAVVMVLTNGVRAYLVMAIASATRGKYLGGEDHIWFGWLLFALVLFAMMWFASRYAQHEEEPESAAAKPEASRGPGIGLLVLLGAGAAVLTMRPLLGDMGALMILVVIAAFLAVAQWRLRGTRGTGSGYRLEASGATPLPLWQWGISMVTFVVLLSGPAIMSRADARGLVTSQPVEFPDMPGCQSRSGFYDAWQPEYAGAVSAGGRTYICDGQEISVHVASYGRPAPGSELVSSVNKPFPVRWDWRAASEYADVEFGEERFRVNELVVTNAGHLLVNWHWYEVGGSPETSGFRVKLRQFFALVTGRSAGGQHVILSVRDPADAEAGRRALQSAAAALFQDDDR